MITYQIANEAEFSGFPVIGNQTYMIGIRENDLYKEEFYFPQGDLLNGQCIKKNLNQLIIGIGKYRLTWI